MGKTELLNAFADGPKYVFPRFYNTHSIPLDFRNRVVSRYEEPTSTVIDQSPANVENVPGAEKLCVWDTVRTLHSQRPFVGRLFRLADGVAVVFDIRSKESFDEIGWWVDEVRKNAREGVPVILVGTKIDDCLDQVNTIIPDTPGQNPRRVSKNDAMLFAAERDMQYFEVSVKTGVGVHEAIFALARMTWDFRDNKAQSTDLTNQHIDVDFESRGREEGGDSGSTNNKRCF